jgi:chemotaxis protein CheD
MRSKFPDLPVVYLHPGEAYFGDKPVLVSTVLGSCISITMFCKKVNYGGISHCLLPTCGREGCANCDEPYKYVNCTMENMLKKFESMKIKKEDIEVKAFGGGDVLITKEESQKSKTIGRQNIAALTKWLENNEMKLTSYDMGGGKGRKIFFLPTTGDVYLKRIMSEKD